MKEYIPWTEKYRPKKLLEVVGQEVIVKSLEAYAKSKNMPHLLFSGKAGVGKTTCALALARELFGENLRESFLELNASDERGIDVVRGKIKDFARTVPLENVPFKIIFLDEADSLTPEAQQALRRTMEKFSSICRFILSCNYSSKIIEPIQSRCGIFKFSPLAEKDIKRIIVEVAEKEKLDVDKGAEEVIVYIAEGDARKALNILQGAAILNRKITKKDIYKIASQATPKLIQELIELSTKGKFVDARKILDTLMIDYSMSGIDIIKQIFKEILNSKIKDREKMLLLEKVGEVEFRLVQGSNERIQLESLIASFATK